MTADYVVRALTLSDAERIAELNTQLGYDVGLSEIRTRLARVQRQAAHHAMGAEAPQGLVAFIHFFERPSIEKGFDMVVQALVVDGTLRKAGVGRLLMQHVEQVARSKGCDAVALSSRAHRQEAHAFYKRLGYELLPASNAFLKRLP